MAFFGNKIEITLIALKCIKQTFLQKFISLAIVMFRQMSEQSTSNSIQRVVATSLEELQRLKENRIPENTQTSTKYAQNLYNTWLKRNVENNLHYPPLECGISELLARSIPRFLCEIRTIKGKDYKSDTIKNIYAALNRYLKTVINTID